MSNEREAEESARLTNPFGGRKDDDYEEDQPEMR